MPRKYDFKKIERKWWKAWEHAGIYEAEDFGKKPKYYALIEFPFPSGEGLHVGHIRSNTAMDIIARKRRMEGYNVLYPIGWDAFGLPTENYAIKTGIPPAKITKKTTDNFRRQLKALGFSFDWTREVNTSDPEYYKWTQWMFIQFFKHGLAYKTNIPINWCPTCRIGLANEEAAGGVCERCGGKVEKKNKEQWMLKITAYAEKLLDGLEELDFLDEIKTQQRNWIGKSEGAEIEFPVVNFHCAVKIFTTRPDTIFGATYLVLAPEHPLLEKLKPGIRNLFEVNQYINTAKKKNDEERTKEDREKTGVELRGVFAQNPATKEKIAIWISDYVLGSYGTGAIMAVPAHDERDFAFAKKYNLPIREVIAPLTDTSSSTNQGELFFVGEGKLISSGSFTGKNSKDVKWDIVKFVGGERKVQYKLHDWVFSRQRYWGEPIPIIDCPNCGFVPVPEKNLPLKLPKVRDYQPRANGESPLAAVESWVNVRCPVCKAKARRETDVMPNWAGSSWYFLAYAMRGISNFEFPISNYQNVFKYWLPVDWYNGGMEHVTLHLLYSRFWNLFLHDIGAVPVGEPYKKRTAHGLVLADGGGKMSKSKGNVINPEEITKAVGADALRLYEMFMGPFDQAVQWDHKGIEGTHRFLMRVWNFSHDPVKFTIVNHGARDEQLERLLHKTIKKVSDDIETMAFNTAISALMIFVNACQKKDNIPLDLWKTFLLLLAPFAPFMTEEIWERQGKSKKENGKWESIHTESWPAYDQKLIEEDTFTLVIQINGKTRDTVEAKRGISEAEAEKIALEREKIKTLVKKKKPKRIVFVKDRLINIII